MSKRSNTENISGYVQNVSPIKKARSGSDYFNFTIQTEEKNMRIVSFNRQVYQKLVNLNNDKSPVKISNTSPAKSNDVIYFNNQLSIQILQNSDVQHSYKEVTNVNKNVETLKKANDVKIDVIKSLQYGQYVNVKRIVTTGLKEPKIVSYGDSTLKVKEDVTIEDTTGACKLHLWEDYIEQFENGKTYEVANLEVKIFKSSTNLSTTRATKITEIEKFVDSIKGNELLNPNAKIVVQEIDAVEKFQIFFTCIKCRKKIVTLHNEAFLKCTHCGVKMRVKNAAKQATINLLVDKLTLTAFTETIEKMLAIDSNVKLTDESNDIEDAIMLLENLTITYDKTTNHIVDVDVDDKQG